MKEEIFRKKSIDKIKSPESLNDYVKVSNPSMWFLVTALVVVLIGITIWSIFGRIDITKKTSVYNEKGKVVCIVEKNDIDAIKKDMIVKIKNGDNKKIEGNIIDISEYDDMIDAYKAYTDIRTNENIDRAEIVLERIVPFSFVTN